LPPGVLQTFIFTPADPARPESAVGEYGRWILYVSHSDDERRRPTLYWNTRKREFGITSMEQIEHARDQSLGGVFEWSIHVPGAESEWLEQR